MNTSKCLVPNCKGKVKTRGLCPTCYGSARHLVRTGKVTWAGMEARGVIAPVKGKGNRGPGARTEWLLTGTALPAEAAGSCCVPSMGDGIKHCQALFECNESTTPCPIASLETAANGTNLEQQSQGS